MTGKIELCTLADLKTLQQVSRATFADTFGAANTPTDLAEYLDTAYSDAQLTQEMQQPTTRFEFILVDDQVAGYLKLNWGASQSERRGPATLEIERIYILPAFKRQGLGRQFYDDAVATAKQLGCRTIWLGVWEHNEPAQKFYQRMGFQQVGDHVFQLGTDAQRDLILEKTLV
ncbi:GNAT family N-acetyltransferase [Levilactobacillus andaensis]|uniref:GNAT family N-acetyltransferase n=1 Tax=Levilactobacillus andaensis TaxID=2799570 RepID=UPI001943A5FB|nr:GNAT family N-acetyltransferase [Levilactobacillus andaensis]